MRKRDKNESFWSYAWDYIKVLLAFEKEEDQELKWAYRNQSLQDMQRAIEKGAELTDKLFKSATFDDPERVRADLLKEAFGNHKKIASWLIKYNTSFDPYYLIQGIVNSDLRDTNLIEGLKNIPNEELKQNRSSSSQVVHKQTEFRHVPTY